MLVLVSNFEGKRKRITYTDLNFSSSTLAAGANKRAPEPNPMMVRPDARPFFSGNHSIRVWMCKLFMRMKVQQKIILLKRPCHHITFEDTDKNAKHHVLE